MFDEMSDRVYVVKRGRNEVGFLNASKERGGAS